MSQSCNKSLTECETQILSQVFLQFVGQESHQLKILNTLFENNVLQRLLDFCGHERDISKWSGALVLRTLVCTCDYFLVLTQARDHKIKIQSFQLYWWLTGNQHLHSLDRDRTKWQMHLTKNWIKSPRRWQCTYKQCSANLAIYVISSWFFFSQYCMQCNDISCNVCVWIPMVLLILKSGVRYS